MPSSSSRTMSGGAQSSPSSSSGKSKSKSNSQLTANEKRIWQAVYDAPNHSMTLAKLERQFSDISVEKRSGALNTLSAKSLVSMQLYNGKLHQFVAASRAEASIIGQLEEVERMVFSHIRDCANEGIWTKNLKARTNIHQTQLTRILKALEGKDLIKAVKSVKFPTRKIYMLYNLQPSVELSGGPWYTDNELDTAFINQLCNLLHKYIASETWPRRSHAGEDDRDRPIFPASHIHNLPSATDCQIWLAKLNVTSTELGEADIESLLDVLVYDGKVDKIPFARLQHSFAGRRSRKRRGSDEWTDKGKRNGYESQSDESEIAVFSEEDGSDESDAARRKRKRSSSKQSEGRKKGRDSYSTSQRRVKRDEDEESSDDDDSEDEDDDDDDDDDDVRSRNNGAISSSFVYRALREIQIEPGWVEVPCAQCPVFDFCSPGGPVNAEGCVYMREWIPRNKSTQARRKLDESTSGVGDVEIKYDEDAQMANGGVTSGDEDGAASAGGVSSPVVGQDDVDDDDYGGEEV